MKPDDLVNAINKAVVAVEVYDAVAAALREAGIDNPSRPWQEIADSIETTKPELAAALRYAQARWSAMLGQR